MNKNRKLTVIHTNNAPKAIGPYAQAIQAGDFLYISGQIGIDPLNSKLVEGGIKSQTLQVLTNIKSILDKAGYCTDDVCKSTCLLDNMNDFTDMNEVYSDFFGNHKPARAAFEVSKLPLSALIEIEIVAFKEK